MFKKITTVLMFVSTVVLVANAQAFTFNLKLEGSVAADNLYINYDLMTPTSGTSQELSDIPPENVSGLIQYLNNVIWPNVNPIKTTKDSQITIGYYKNNALSIPASCKNIIISGTKVLNVNVKQIKPDEVGCVVTKE